MAGLVPAIHVLLAPTRGMPRRLFNCQLANMALKPYVSRDIICSIIWWIRFNMRTLDDVIGKLPAARRQKVEARAQELIAEQLTLQDIRKARKLTQEQMATTLNIGQDSISRREKRRDMMLSTMRGYIEAMGGSLELVALSQAGSRDYCVDCRCIAAGESGLRTEEAESRPRLGVREIPVGGLRLACQ
jgi:DNA-binding XRE family transcriptional regulator